MHVHPSRIGCISPRIYPGGDVQYRIDSFVSTVQSLFCEPVAVALRMYLLEPNKAQCGRSVLESWCCCNRMSGLLLSDGKQDQAIS